MSCKKNTVPSIDLKLKTCVLTVGMALVSAAWTEGHAAGFLILSGNNQVNDITIDITQTGDYNRGVDTGSGTGNTNNFSGDITTEGLQAHGIYNEGNSNTITLTSELETNGIDSKAIWNKSGRGNTTIVTGTGSVTTRQMSSEGIRNTLDGNSTVISGEILTEGDDSTGVYNEGGENSTVISGEISTEGDDSTGVYNRGDENITTLMYSGRILTEGQNAHGVFNTSEGGNNTTTISGAIRTDGIEAHGIYNEGDSNTTTVSGSITTAGDGSAGIRNEGSENSTTITGEINTTGVGYDNDSEWVYADGVVNVGDSNATSVSGQISTVGDDARGIVNWGDNNTTIVSGSIATEGDWAWGIFNPGDGNTTTVRGSIRTVGDSADGVYNDGAFNTTTVSGTISTIGGDAHGIYDVGVGNNTNLTGTIVTTGVDSNGVYIEGSSNSLTIFGTIKSTQAFSINVEGTDNIVTIGRGARLVGGISSDDSSNTLRLSLGSAKSYIFATQGDWTLEDLDGRAVVAGSAMAAGIGNLETADEMQFGRLERLNSALSRSSTLDASQAQSWAVPYVSTGKRKADALTPAVTHYDTKSMGVVAGKPTDWWGGKADLLLQLDHNKLNIAGNDHVITSTSARMGLRVSDTDLSTQSSQSVNAMVGYNHYDSARSVLVNENTTTGETTFNAKFGSVEFLLGGVASTAYQLTPKMKLKTDAQVDVSYEMIDSYTESTYFSWKKRNLLQASARVAATVEREHQHNLHSLWGLAISHRNVLKGREGDYAINGTSVSFKGGDHKDTVATLSAGIKYNFKKDMTLRADVSTSISANRVSNHNANIKLDWKF